MKKMRVVPIIFLGLVILLVGSCVCLIGQSAIIPWLENRRAAASLETDQAQPLDSEASDQVAGSNSNEAAQPVFPKSTAGVQAGPTDSIPAENAAVEMERLLNNTLIPASDPFDLAARLEGKTGIAPTVDAPLFPYPVGTQKAFWLLNTDTDQRFQSQAILQYASDHLYFWVETGVPFDESALQSLAETFEQTIYPTTRSYFGSEWTPGVDGDARLHILYAHNLGNSVGGYYTPSDEYPPLLNEYSNAHEMFVFNADTVALDTEYAYGVLAHEFQHMIHWNLDRNEDIWVNEGFSELAMLLNGYSVGGSDYSYVENPDIQLNHWPQEASERPAHYGASFLFYTYILDRFGETAIRSLAASAENGLEAVDQFLANQGAEDPATGQKLTVEDIFADWAITTYLQDEQAADGRYAYHIYPEAPQPGETESVHFCPSGVANREVSQYGADYIRILCRGEHTLSLSGTATVPLLPADPFSGKYAFWSNRADESDMTLTQTFDFRNISGPLSLNYQAWYDLEKNYDYLYLEASLDGKNWRILPTPSGTPEDPNGSSYGWGYNGLSGGGKRARWIQEQVDLTQFAGQQVQLRFEYITDTGLNASGFMLDDVSIPEIGYASDFETDDGGWQASGFVRMQNVLPQVYRVSLIKIGEQTTVEKFTLVGDQKLTIPLSIGSDTREVILVVSGTARYSRQKALYQYSLDR